MSTKSKVVTSHIDTLRCIGPIDFSGLIDTALVNACEYLTDEQIEEICEELDSYQSAEWGRLEQDNARNRAISSSRS